MIKFRHIFFSASVGSPTLALGMVFLFRLLTSIFHNFNFHLPALPCCTHAFARWEK
ncbi:unnamed protein product [Meloidogyne enterolobii]|uniref:Uncharacterized protein n=1 Tax=Meloidogyne enterolobii TaxID=390850 RepID=A0ACB0ZUG8_MELEN